MLVLHRRPEVVAKNQKSPAVSAQEQGTPKLSVSPSPAEDR